MTSAVSAIIGVVLILSAILAPIIWTVQRILMPIDRAGKAREGLLLVSNDHPIAASDMVLRFSIGDFLCLFLIVQVPLAFVFRIDGKETRPHYWVMMGLIWLVAPFVWFTCARALSKAGIVSGLHRFVFLGLVVPAVYYGLFPFIGLSLGGILKLFEDGPNALWENSLGMGLWCVLATAFVLGGFYSPWLERKQAQVAAAEEVDVR